jgi:hypothetical protein
MRVEEWKIDGEKAPAMENGSTCDTDVRTAASSGDDTKDTAIAAAEPVQGVVARFVRPRRRGLFSVLRIAAGRTGRACVWV